MSIIKKSFRTKGMTCSSCEKVIAKQALKLPGVKSIDVDYATEKAVVEYDNDKTSYEEIKKKIESKGYTCEEENSEKNNTNNNTWGWLFAVLGIMVVGYFILKLFSTIKVPELSQNMGYGLLFIVGLLTGIHCVSMCGGFVVSYTTKGIQQGKKPHQMHLSYAIGKTISYTVIGAAFGFVGSIIAFTPMMRGIAGLLAGIFLVLFGLKMLNIVPGLRKFNVRLPRFLNRFVGEESKIHRNNPLVIGLLNGLMIACGPLQAMYIMAAGTGSWIEGAKMLFIFGLGTLPIMLSFGYLTSFISAKATQKILKASGVIVLILGLVMINRGLTLTGSGYDLNTLTASWRTTAGSSVSAQDDLPVLKEGYQEIRMDVLNGRWSPNKFVLQKGVPVRWIINGKELNGCNSGIQVPKLGLEFNIKQGEQVIEFTPTEAGTIPWSCLMGMIPGTFIVKDTIDLNDAGAVQKELDTVAVPTGGSCRMGGGGGCGCGMR